MKLIDYVNQRETDVEIEEIGPAGSGYNAPIKIRANGVLGFKKKSINAQVFDKFEYLIVQLGKMLGINTTDTYFFDDGSIFSKSIYQEGEEFLKIEDILKHISVAEEEFEEKERFDSSLKTISINGKNKYIVSSSKEIEFAINIFVRVIKKLHVKNEQEIIRDYIRMCFLDTLTGNKDRVNGNYGLIKREKDYSFSPLFDSSTLNYPGIDDNYIQLNNYLIDRDLLYSYLITNYPEYLNDIFNVDKNEVISKLQALEDKVFEGNKSQKDWFESMVTKKLPGYLDRFSIFFPKDNSKKGDSDQNGNSKH